MRMSTITTIADAFQTALNAKALLVYNIAQPLQLSTKTTPQMQAFATIIMPQLLTKAATPFTVYDSVANNMAILV